MIGIDTNILLRLWLNDDPAFTATFARGVRKLPGVKVL
jgi:predicted nucleic-acid-binding protein